MHAEGPFVRRTVYAEMNMLTYQDFSTLQNSDPLAVSAGQLFALIDHAGMPGLVKKLAELNVQWVSLFEGSRDAGALSVAPILFEIEAEQGSSRRKALLRWLGERGTYTSSMLFMTSPLPMPELARRLALRLDATLPDDLDVILRYFDTRVFESLIGILSAQQKWDFLCVADCWWFVDRSGIFQCVNSTFSEPNEQYIPLAFSVPQEGALIDASEPDQVASLLRSSTPLEYENLPVVERHAFVVRHIDAARLDGIEATNDLSLYCSLALLHGDHFFEQENWRSIIETVRAGEMSLIQAIEQTEIEE